jgi:hypothetical protein
MALGRANRPNHHQQWGSRPAIDDPSKRSDTIPEGGDRYRVEIIIAENELCGW